MASHENYAEKLNPNGTKVKYKHKADYEWGRFQASGSMAAQRANINRAVGGNIV